MEQLQPFQSLVKAQWQCLQFFQQELPLAITTKVAIKVQWATPYPEFFSILQIYLNFKRQCVFRLKIFFYQRIFSFAQSHMVRWQLFNLPHDTTKDVTCYRLSLSLKRNYLWVCPVQKWSFRAQEQKYRIYLACQIVAVVKNFQEAEILKRRILDYFLQAPRCDCSPRAYSGLKAIACLLHVFS